MPHGAPGHPGPFPDDLYLHIQVLVRVEPEVSGHELGEVADTAPVEAMRTRSAISLPRTGVGARYIGCGLDAAPRVMSRYSARA